MMFAPLGLRTATALLGAEASFRALLRAGRCCVLLGIDSLCLVLLCVRSSLLFWHFRHTSWFM